MSSSAALLLICLCSTLGQEPLESSPGWPQWRGPTQDGISAETHIANAWPQEGPQVLWARDIGQGYSGFIGVGDRVYTLTQTLYEQAVICLEADTGRQIWSRRFSWPYEGGGLYPGPRATPTWFQDRIYYAAPDGSIGCLNADDGTVVWTKNPKQQHHGQGTDFGCACSPLVIDGKVIVPVGGRGASVVALNAENGETVWASGDEPASYCTPQVITFQGRQQVVTLLENSFAAFDLKSGKPLWDLDLSHGYNEHAAAPLYREPEIFMAGPFRSGAKLLRITPRDKVKAGEAELKVETVWENPKFSNDVASSVLVDDYIYGFDVKDAQSKLNRPSRGEFRCLEFKTGKAKWSTDKVGQANIIVADGKLILFNDNGEVILAKVDPEKYTELARTTIYRDEVCWTPPALHRGRLYLRTHTRAVCLYIGSEPLELTQPTTAVADLRTVRRFNANSLLGGEREYPATTPEWKEFAEWYRWSLLGLVASFGTGLVIAIVCRIASLMFHRRRPASDGSTEVRSHFRWDIAWRSGFWLSVLLSGALGSALLNPRLKEERYVFTWPLALWAIFQLTLMMISWCERQADKRRARWWSRSAGLILILTSVLYFHLCRRLGLSIEWSYLIGFLPAFPVAALCARWLTRSQRFFWLTDPLLTLASFSAYFWAAAWFMKWWLRVGS